MNNLDKLQEAALAMPAGKFDFAGVPAALYPPSPYAPGWLATFGLEAFVGTFAEACDWLAEQGQ